jgi:hypothetical protein
MRGGGRLAECALRIAGARVQARVPRTALRLSELTKLGPGVSIYRTNTRHYLTTSDKELLRSSDRRGGDCILRNTPFENLASCSSPDPVGLDCARTGLFSSPQLRNCRLGLYTAGRNSGRNKPDIRRALIVPCAVRKLTLACIGMMTSARGHTR